MSWVEVAGMLPAILEIDESRIGTIGAPEIAEASTTVPSTISQLSES